MTQDQWTLIFLRGEESPVRQYSLSPRALYLAIGGLAAVLTSVSGLTLAVGLGGAARLKARSLEEQNEVLVSTLDQLQGRVLGLEETLGELAEKDAQLRVVAGLEAIEGDVLEVGIGGPGSRTPGRHPLHPRADALERRARLLTESLYEASDSLEAHRELLEATPSILPTAGLLSSKFSRSRYHPIHHQSLPHEGVDISAPKGTAILAAANGRVVQGGWFAGYGQMVEVDHGNGVTTRYGHASKVMVRVGQQVERGDVIAQVGSTGIATSPHLHYEVRVDGKPQNPLNYVLPPVAP